MGSVSGSAPRGEAGALDWLLYLAHETQACSPERLNAVRLELASLRARLGEMEKRADAARAFLTKYDELEPAIKGAFVFMHVHGASYDGPTYEAELKALRAALEQT